MSNLPNGIVHTGTHEHWTGALGQGIIKKSLLTVFV